MANGIEFFLTQRVQDSDKHPRRWIWHVLDSEVIHQNIIHILIDSSPAFSQSLLGGLETWICTRQPERGTFDLVAKSAEEEIFIEIKCDQMWSDDQKEKQRAFLQKNARARCAMILFSQRAARVTRADVQMVGDQFFKITYSEMYKALEAVRRDANSPGVEPGLVEFAAGYKVALAEQEQRTRITFGDPNV